MEAGARVTHLIQETQLINKLGKINYNLETLNRMIYNGKKDNVNIK